MVEAELEAIFFVMLVLRSRRDFIINGLCVRSDSLISIELILKHRAAPRFLVDLLDQIEVLAKNFEVIRF